MSGFSVWLAKDGLRRAREGEAFVPPNVFDLLRVWHCRLEEIDPDCTLGDLCALLRRVEGIECLSPMLACDVAAFLAEAQKAPSGDDDDDLRYLEVYNTAELTRYLEDPDNPDEPTRFVDEEEADEHDAMADAVAELTGEPKPLRIVDVIGDDPVTGKPRRRRIIAGTQNGKWVGPYHLDRGFHGWGRWHEPYPGFFAENPEIDPGSYEGGIALDFTPVNELAHLPLRYNPAVAFEGRRQEEGGGFAEGIGITFGELVHAVFGELGFMGSPEVRDENRAVLDERMRELKQMLAEEEEGDEPWR